MPEDPKPRCILCPTPGHHGPTGQAAEGLEEKKGWKDLFEFRRLSNQAFLCLKFCFLHVRPFWRLLLQIGRCFRDGGLTVYGTVSLEALGGLVAWPWPGC